MDTKMVDRWQHKWFLGCQKYKQMDEWMVDGLTVEQMDRLEEWMGGWVVIWVDFQLTRLQVWLAGQSGDAQLHE